MQIVLANGSNLVEEVIFTAVGIVLMVYWQLVLCFNYPAGLAQLTCLHCMCAPPKQL